jgi:hypothetical protein
LRGNDVWTIPLAPPSAEQVAAVEEQLAHAAAVSDEEEDEDW